MGEPVKKATGVVRYRSAGVAFVAMSSPEAATRIVSDGISHLVYGVQVRVSAFEPRHDLSRKGFAANNREGAESRAQHQQEVPTCLKDVPSTMDPQSPWYVKRSEKGAECVRIGKASNHNKIPSRCWPPKALHLRRQCDAAGETCPLLLHISNSSSSSSSIGGDRSDKV